MRLRLASLALLLCAAPAPAAVVSLDQDFGTFYVTAALGEENRVTIERDEGVTGDGLVHVTDAGAPLSAGPGCRSVSAHEATCSYPEEVFPLDAYLHLFDGDDSLDLPAPLGIGDLHFIDLGEGDDTMTSGPDELQSKLQTERRLDSHITLGPGDDEATLNLPSRGYVDGDEGDDVVIARVPFAAQPEDPGVFDALQLSGDAGDDTLTGGDLMDGGEGDDTLDSADRAPSGADCGAGEDRLLMDAGDEQWGCEAREVPDVVLPIRP